jgi:hypothetical protein
LKGSRIRDRVRLAIDVADPALADRIAAALADVETLELVGKHDEPDALAPPVSMPTSTSRPASRKS